MRVLGFDIGVASIGWALVEDSIIRDECKIIDCGVRTFESVGEKHKERGEQRRARRNVARTKSRLNNIKKYLFENFASAQGDFADFNEWQKKLFAKNNESEQKEQEIPTPYLLRKKALKEQISVDELCQIVIHIVKHRAYNDSGKEYEAENILEAQDETIQVDNKSVKENNKDEKKDKNADKKKLKAAMKENVKQVSDKAYLNEYIYDRQKRLAQKNAEIKYQKLLEKFKNESKYESVHKLEAKKERWIATIAEHSIKMRNGSVVRINKNGKEVEEQSYVNSMPRSAIKAELQKILDTQIAKAKQDESYAQKLEKLKTELFAENDNGLGFLQNRPLKSSQNLLGKCSIDMREYRASAFAPSVIEFNLLAKLANLLIYLNGQHKDLDIDYEKTSESAIRALQEKQKLDFSDIRSCIYLKSGESLAQTYEIELLGFNKKETKTNKLKSTKKTQNKDSDKLLTQEKNATFYNPSKKLALLEATFGKDFWSHQKDIDKLTGILSVNKRKKDIQKELNKHKYSHIDDTLKANALNSLGAGFSGTSAYCLNVIWECLKNMRLGMSEYEATTAYKANLNEDRKYQEFISQFTKSLKLPAFEETPNANLNHICAQMRQIANAIFAKHGEVAKIRIELLREVGQSEKQKKEIQKAQDENKKFNEVATKICEEIGLKTTNKDNITKVKLWILQNECDIYPSIQKGSQDKFNAKEFYADYKDEPSIDVYAFKKISLQDLCDENALQIDHIIPKSKVLVDEFTNKVLTFTNNNATKTSQTPYEWFGADKAKWKDFKARVEMTNLSKKAKDNLLKQEIDDIKPSRLLNDTKTASVYIKNYLEKYVKFADIPNDLQDDEERESKQIRRIEVVNGRLTSTLRHFWGIGKKDRTNHLHHAQDAVIIAFCSSRTIQHFAKFLQTEEDKSQAKLSSEEITKIMKQNSRGRWVFRRPFSGFVADLTKRIYGDETSDGIFVTFSKKHKTTGKLHNENPINIKQGVEEALKQNKDTAKHLKKEDIKELKKRLKNAQSEISLRVEQEKAKLGRMLSGEEYGKIKSKIEHPIKEQLYKEVKQRQIQNNVWIEIRGHIYEIDGMTRIDIFRLNNRYYAVPVFITDKELSHIAKPDNCELDDKDFLFSLHIGDLIEFEYSDKIKKIKRYGYYRGFKQSGDVIIYHHSGYLTLKEKEENFWNDEQVSKDKKTGKKVTKAIFPQKILKIHLFKSLKLCHINALGHRQTPKGDRVHRERGKAPLCGTLGKKKIKFDITKKETQ